MSWFPQPGEVRSRRFGWHDLVILAFLAALLAALSLETRGAIAPARGVAGPVDLSLGALPVDALRSLFRIFVAFVFSILFSIGYGWVAAYSPKGRRIMVPLLDILQSVPVLGFLAVAVTFFAGVFPGTTLGFEFAAILTIFTAQAWNMTFAFYHALRTMPKDLDEATRMLRLTRWERLWHLEVPSAVIPLVLNAMMSFGASWFFLAASESFLFHGQRVNLPGIGSYIAAAQARGDTHAVLWALLATVVLIVAVDQLFWRPIVAWSEKFKLEQVPSEPGPPSFILTVLRRSALVGVFESRVLDPLAEFMDRIADRPRRRRVPRAIGRYIPAALLVLGGAFTAFFLGKGILEVGAEAAGLIPHAFVLGLATLGRVLASVALGAVWTVPVGVAIGLSPRLTRWGQPIAQLAASFPANIIFPFIVALFFRLHVGLNIGAIPLMMLGTQWYILFNVMAGTIAIPADLKEAARVFGLRGTEVWKSLIIPAIFPSLVTGGITAAGGAWNASIVAEVVTWGHHTATATGLGAMITEATAAGHNVALLVGVLVMSILVVTTNRLLWRPLYRLAETKFHVES